MQEHNHKAIKLEISKELLCGKLKVVSLNGAVGIVVNVFVNHESSVLSSKTVDSHAEKKPTKWATRSQRDGTTLFNYFTSRIKT